MPRRLPLLSMFCLSFLHIAQPAIAAPADPLGACRLAEAPGANFALQVPFEVVDGRIYVQARVNQDGPFRFAIDTGASGMGVFRDVMRLLPLFPGARPLASELRALQRERVARRLTGELSAWLEAIRDHLEDPRARAAEAAG